MFLVPCIVLQSLLLFRGVMVYILYRANYLLRSTGHAWQPSRNMGPPCYGRSDCVVPFVDTTPIPTEKRPEEKIPKRYIMLEDFKSPIFGSYKYDPVLDEFVMSVPGPSTGGPDMPQESTGASPSAVMRAAETTTAEPLSNVRKANDIEWLGNDSDATLEPLK